MAMMITTNGTISLSEQFFPTYKNTTNQNPDFKELEHLCQCQCHFIYKASTV